MKNVLFATTALVCVAGVASAGSDGPVALSGSAEIGVTYLDDPTVDLDDDGVADGVDEAAFHNDIDVTFTLSGSTNGLTFGASIDLDEAGDGDGVEFENSAFIEGRFGTLTMGDTDGAYDQALDGIYAGGLSDEADLASGTSGFDGLSPEILRYDYSVGGITLSGSLALENQMNINDEAGGSANAALSENVYGLGISYSGTFSNFDVSAGAGVQFTSTDDAGGAGDGDHIVYGASVELGFSDFAVLGVVEIYDRPNDSTAFDDGEVFGVGAEYAPGPYSVAVGFQSDNRDDADFETVFQGFATYDLGGGAELVGAVGFGETPGGDEILKAGFGIGLSF